MGRYLRPVRLDDALAALGPGVTVVAGGTDHFPARVLHTPEEDILDITALPLRSIVRHDDHWWIPCLATWTDLIEADLPPQFDALVQAARQIGGRQVQNAATLVGNLCNASPAADGFPCFLALDAEVELASQNGTRRLPVAQFVHGPRRTDRRPDELVLGLRIPHAPAARSHFRKLGGRRYLVISIAMLAVVLECDPGGRITRACIAIGACSPQALRLRALEEALIGHPPGADLVQPHHLDCLSPIDDIRATAAYRRHAALELTRRAVAHFAIPTSIAA